MRAFQVPSCGSVSLNVHLIENGVKFINIKWNKLFAIRRAVVILNCRIFVKIIKIRVFVKKINYRGSKDVEFNSKIKIRTKLLRCRIANENPNIASVLRCCDSRVRNFF